MKLSEAIRLGSMIGRQARGQFSQERRKYFFGLVGPKAKEFCALGGAYQAATGGRFTLETVTHERQAFRGMALVGQQTQIMETPAEWPMEWPAVCPQCSRRDVIKRLVPHLNDDHKWTCQRIADFVESEELKLQRCEDALIAGYNAATEAR